MVAKIPEKVENSRAMISSPCDLFKIVFFENVGPDTYTCLQRSKFHKKFLAEIFNLEGSKKTRTISKDVLRKLGNNQDEWVSFSKCDHKLEETDEFFE